MAKNRGNGWFRIRLQTKGEVVYFCRYSVDPASGDRTENSTSSDRYHCSRTRRAGGKRWEGSDSLRSLTIPYPT
jgi:hypothetical protein